MGAARHRRSKPTERLAERVAAFGDLLPERGERRFRCLGKGRGRADAQTPTNPWDGTRGLQPQRSSPLRSRERSSLARSLALGFVKLPDFEEEVFEAQPALSSLLLHLAR